MRTTLGRGSAYALTSLCVSTMAILRPPQEHEERFSFILASCQTANGDTERGLARSLRSEKKRGHEESNNEK